MERKPHGRGMWGEWGVAGDGDEHSGFCIFPLLKIIQLKNIHNNNNNNKVMFWISVNLQRQSLGEFGNVFTTTNQNYVTFYCV